MDKQKEDIYLINKQAMQLIQKFLHGESQSFHSLVRLFNQRVIRIIQKMVYSHHDVEDLTNEVWLKVAQNLHKFDQSLPFHSWLYRLVSNTCIDFLRKRKDITMEDDQLYNQLHQNWIRETHTPESLFLQKEFQSHLESLLSQLEETDRLIITLRFSEDLSYDEIGAIVGMSKNTVGTRLFRARKQLKSLFEDRVAERRVINASY